MKIILYFIAGIFIIYSSLSAKEKQIICKSNLDSPILNFCEVKPNVLWRGHQPDKDAFSWLINTGVKTIINLELLHNDLENISKAIIADTGTVKINYYRVKTWEPLYAVTRSSADEDVIHFLSVMSRAEQPVYVHCRAGENRTGVMVAAFKIIIEGKASPSELAEVLSEMQSYEGVWSDSTKKYIEGLAQRREEIIKRVKEYKTEKPKIIFFEKGNYIKSI